MARVTAQELVRTMSDYCNGGGEGRKAFADEMLKEHRTLQQSMAGLTLEYIKALAATEYYDGRNEASVKLAQKLMAAIDGNIALPFI